MRKSACDDDIVAEALVITGTIRSGTTWLAQVLAGIEDTGVLYEPLQVGRVPEACTAGLGQRTELARGEKAPAARAFFARTLAGRLRNDSLLRMMPARFDEPRRWVVKLAHGNRLLAWLANQFPIRRPILIMRHPCAVVASILPRRTREQLAGLEERAFLVRHPSYRPIWDSLDRPEEKLAMRWSIEQLIPLSEPRPYPFHTVLYEDLVRDGSAVLDAVFADWGLPAPTDIHQRLQQPSITDSGSRTSPREPADRLSRWRSALDRRQVKAILATVRALGIDWYDESPEPDRARLAAANLVLHD